METYKYQLKKEGNGVYAFVLDGSITIEGQALDARDGFGIWNTAQIDVQANTNSRILLMEVPMEF